MLSSDLKKKKFKFRLKSLLDTLYLILIIFKFLIKYESQFGYLQICLSFNSDRSLSFYLLNKSRRPNARGSGIFMV